jgi:hypothetical protein
MVAAAIGELCFKQSHLMLLPLVLLLLLLPLLLPGGALCPASPSKGRRPTTSKWCGSVTWDSITAVHRMLWQQYTASSSTQTMLLL